MTSVLSGIFDGGFLGSSAQKPPEIQIENHSNNSNNDSVNKIDSAANVGDYSSPPREKTRPTLTKNNSVGGSLLMGSGSSPFRGMR